jgi:hypothetical protein
MTTIINGSSPSITFSDSTTQTTAFTGSASQITSGTLPTAQLPTGSILQVVGATTTTSTSTTSSSFVDTGLTASITPSSATSKILVIISQSFYIANNTGGRDEAEGRLNLTRASTNIYEFGVQVGATSLGNQKRMEASYAITILDSPSTTSSVTYKTQMRGSGYEDAVAQRSSYRSAITLIEVKA